MPFWGSCCPLLQVFEEEALSWEDKLNRINVLFDVWIDVQRRWVYLEGIFQGSTDIKHLLPTETQKFQRYVLPSSSLCPMSTHSFILAALHVVMCLGANSSCSISTEFLSLMRKVGKTPQIMEILAIPQVQKLLERLSDLLTKIQKALGEYLEKERASFPR